MTTRAPWTFKTHWSGSVAVDGQTKSSTGGDTLPDLLTRLVADAVYYQAVYPQGKVTVSELVERCDRCSGQGEVPKQGGRVLFRRVRCPECRGRPPKGVVSFVPGFEFRMPDSANAIRLVWGEAPVESNS